MVKHDFSERETNALYKFPNRCCAALYFAYEKLIFSQQIFENLLIVKLIIKFPNIVHSTFEVFRLPHIHCCPHDSFNIKFYIQYGFSLIPTHFLIKIQN